MVPARPALTAKVYRFYTRMGSERMPDRDDMETSSRVNKAPASHEFAKTLIKLTVGGGMAFWATTVALSLLPVAAEYRAALSLSYFQTVFVEALIAGMIIGCCVSFALLRFFERLPTKSAILKSEILSFIALAILFVPVQVAANRAESADALHVFLIGAALNVPRFLLLGLVIGYLYRKAAVTRFGRRPVSATPA